MNRLYANENRNIDGVSTYMVLENRMVMENLNVIYGEDKALKLVNNMITINASMYSITRFCNFIVIMRFAPENGFSLEFIEHKDLNQGLEILKVYKEKNWKLEDIDAIMHLIHEIKETDSEPCEISIAPISL